MTVKSQADGMNFLNKDVENEYLRWKQVACIAPAHGVRDCATVDDVLRAHFLIVDFFIGSEYGVGGVGPRDINLLHSAISRQHVSLGLREKWPEQLQKVATLLFGLVKDHPFHDANKRTAFLVTLYQLDRLGRTPKASVRDFENFLVEVADNRLGKYARFKELSAKDDDAEVLFIHDFLKRNTREIDRRNYTVTFHELNQILKKHGFELANPNGNYIDLVRVRHSKGILGLRPKPKRIETKLAKIGFPGWKKQVRRDLLKIVREKSGLTPEKGYDAKVLFEGADPLTALISIYEGPLRNLADR